LEKEHFEKEKLERERETGDFDGDVKRK